MRKPDLSMQTTDGKASASYNRHSQCNKTFGVALVVSVLFVFVSANGFERASARPSDAVAQNVESTMSAPDASGAIARTEATDAEEVIGERWRGYTYQELMVPMRDGVRLRTHVLMPKNTDRPTPIMFSRSPYGWIRVGGQLGGSGDLYTKTGMQDALIQDEYIFVLQDERGRYGSEGAFELVRPFYSKSAEGGVDDTTDTYDTIAWAIANLKGHNGRVGLTGTSYRGWHAMVGLIDPHPAVKAAAPSATMSEGFFGDDFYHNGALQLAFGLQFLARAIDGYPDDEKEGNAFANRPMGLDGYDFFLRAGSLKGLAPFLPKHRPATEAILANDTYNEFYQKRALRRYLRRPVTVPTLHIAGWYDGEDNRGPLEYYHVMEAFDENDQNMIVAGPWYHGAWRFEKAESFGPLSFGSETGTFFTEKVWAPFFRHHLKDAPEPNIPEALLFDTGVNKWRRFDEWPISGSKKIKLFLHQDGRAAFTEAPEETASDAFDAYVSDPANPVPYYPRPNLDDWQKDYMVQDQRFALRRPDVLVYATSPLEEDLLLCGRATAKLFASTEGTDTDWVVKLIDQYPETHDDKALRGFQRLIQGEIFRAKFRNSFSEPTPVAPGKVEAYSIDLLERCHTVKKGHRLVIHVQSTWFPLFDRNPNVFTKISEADADDFTAVENRIYRSSAHPSHIELTILP